MPDFTNYHPADKTIIFMKLHSSNAVQFFVW